MASIEGEDTAFVSASTAEAGVTPVDPSQWRKTEHRTNPLRHCAGGAFDDPNEEATLAAATTTTAAPQRAERLRELVRIGTRRCELAPQFRATVFGPFLDDPNVLPRRALRFLAESTAKHMILFTILQSYLPRECWKLSVFVLFFKRADLSERWLMQDWPKNPFRVVHYLLCEAKQHTLTVFSIFQEQIAAFLGVGGGTMGEDLNNWRLAAPEEPYAAALLQRDDHQRLVVAWIENEAAAALTPLKLDITKVDERARKEIVARAMTRAAHALVGKRAAAAQIVAMAQATPKQRRAELKAALKKRGLELRSDSKLCQAWISMSIGAVLEEVVAVMQIARTLFDVSHVAWSHNREFWEDELRDNVLDGDLTWEESLELVLENDVDYDDSDFSEDAHGPPGCWDCGGEEFPCYDCGRGVYYF